MSEPTRREWMGAAAGAGVAAAATMGSLPSIARAAASPANTLRVACLGAGGRCRFLMKPLATIADVKIVAVADVWDKHLADAKALAQPDAATVKDFRRLLDDKSIDAVLIGSPDHWHVPMTIAALQAGKHVYVEKPLTHSLAEGKPVTDAAAKAGKVVQVGTQQRSMPHLQEARDLIQAGAIGPVFKVKMSWNRNTNRVKRFPLGVDPKAVDWTAFLGSAPKQDFDEYRFRNWRWFWDFGNGILTDLMVHWLDVAHWVLKVDRPERAVTIGAQQAAAGVWETPDTIQTLLQYPGGVQMHFAGTFSNQREASMIEFQGTQGSIYADRGRYELIPEPNAKIEAKQKILGDGPKGRDFYNKPDGELLHLQDWVDAIRTGKANSAPVSAGVASAAAAHLANAAFRNGTGVAGPGEVT